MKQYLAGSLIALLLMAAGVALFNYWVDPYAIYRYESADTDRISRLNQTFNMRMSKPWQVAQVNPSSLVIGSSRAGTVPPSHELWAGEESYNLSMPGLTLYEMLRLIQHVNANGELARLAIGLEYETFITGEPRVGLGFEEGRLDGAEPEISVWKSSLQLVRDLRDTLLTGYAIVRSFKALSGTETTIRFSPDGSWHNKPKNWPGERRYIMVGKNLVSRAKQADASLDANLATFADVLEYCYRNGIDTRLYLSPEHLFLTDLRQHIGLDTGWQEFHRQLIDLNEQVAAAGGYSPFPLWGFNQMTGIVDEPIPRGEGSADNWFKDGIHFQGRLGTIIMNQIWGQNENIGYRLDGQSVQQYIDQVEALRQQFVNSQPRQVQRYREKILGGQKPRSGQ
ncbi:MAG: hypothetical protein V7746_18270 [Halioglobus sp.]